MTKPRPSTVKLLVTALILAGFLALPYLLEMLAPAPKPGSTKFETEVRRIVNDELLNHDLITPSEERTYDVP